MKVKQASNKLGWVKEVVWSTYNFEEINFVELAMLGSGSSSLNEIAPGMTKVKKGAHFPLFLRQFADVPIILNETLANKKACRFSTGFLKWYSLNANII